MRHPTYHDAQERFIIDNAKDLTVKQMCVTLGLGEAVVRNIGSKHHLAFKRAVYPKPVTSKKLRPVLVKKQEEVITFKRPPAEYNQIKSPYGISSEMRKL